MLFVSNRCVLLLLLLSGCPSTTKTTPDSTPDTGLQVNEAGIAICSNPGAICTPADICGLNARCGDDHLCITDGYRDCNDGIHCTLDRCVPGGCVHQVEDGFCLVDETCYKKGAKVGCGRCSPEVSKTRFTPMDGLFCDDRNPCTKGDECKQGVCIGQPYSCSDSLSCTTDSCDGMGGCQQFLNPGHCLIEKTCFKNGQTDSTGCFLCDVSISPHTWQTRVNVCKIEGQCYADGSKDPTGCFTCDSKHATDVWTPLPGLCLIRQVCVQKGSLHPSGCATCVPDKNSKDWTPIDGASMTHASFTDGLEGYLPSKPAGKVGWQLSQTRFVSPPTSLYYGNPAANNYDSGTANSGTVISPAFQLKAGQKAYFSFQLYMDTELAGNFDVLLVRANSQVLWSKSTNMASSNYQKWIPILLDLSPFSGQTVSVEFVFDTKDDLNNKSEGVYIDDVILLTECGAM